MRLLSEAEAKGEMQWFEECARVAKQSPCRRAHCGAVIVKDGEIISEGHNSPPGENPAYARCLDEYEIPAGFRHDRTCCIHAEQRAIDNAYKSGRGEELKKSRMYFVRVSENGEMEKADKLVCTICSRAVLDAGIPEFALYWTDGVRIYGASEFDELSHQYKTPKKS